eukprot:727862-Rhodomonas_salina.2
MLIAGHRVFVRGCFVGFGCLWVWGCKGGFVSLIPAAYAMSGPDMQTRGTRARDDCGSAYLW